MLHGTWPCSVQLTAESSLGAANYHLSWPKRVISAQLRLALSGQAYERELENACHQAESRTSVSRIENLVAGHAPVPALHGSRNEAAVLQSRIKGLLAHKWQECSETPKHPVRHSAEAQLFMPWLAAAAEA